MRRTETPKPIWIKFCTVVDIPDVVTYTNFGDHRLRVFWVAGGQISPSPIDFHRRPYNTLALPCERVISLIFMPTSFSRYFFLKKYVAVYSTHHVEFFALGYQCAPFLQSDVWRVTFNCCYDRLVHISGFVFVE